MNSYRIDTFKMEGDSWKAAAYKCGAFIGEAKGSTEAWAVFNVTMLLCRKLQLEGVE